MKPIHLVFFCRIFGEGAHCRSFIKGKLLRKKIMKERKYFGILMRIFMYRFIFYIFGEMYRISKHSKNLKKGKGKGKGKKS